MRPLPLDVPVDPDSGQAQDWIVGELSKPEYQAAKPTWFDQLAQAILDWLGSLSLPSGDGSVPWWLGLILVVVLAIAVIAFLVYGLPRLDRRRRAATGALFGEDEERSADELRRDAERAAAAGDWTTAIVELYRALARSLAERTVVTTSPGTTALGFARRAGVVFPDAAERLLASAAAFDDVRYLGGAGDEPRWLALAALERELRAARPARREPAGAPA